MIPLATMDTISFSLYKDRSDRTTQYRSKFSSTVSAIGEKGRGGGEKEEEEEEREHKMKRASHAEKILTYRGARRKIPIRRWCKRMTPIPTLWSGFLSLAIPRKHHPVTASIL